VSVFILLFRILLNQLVVIFVLRTWAIWERSRPILVFLIGLTIVTVAVPHTNYIFLTGWLKAFTVLSIVVIKLPLPTALGT
jgi:hypothetical protein